MKVKEKNEIASNDSSNLRWKEKVIWKEDRPRSVGGPRAQTQPYSLNERRIMAGQERVGNLVMVRRQNSQLLAKGHQFKWLITYHTWYNVYVTQYCSGILKCFKIYITFNHSNKNLVCLPHQT